MTTTTTPVRTKYLTLKESNALLRKALKERFPTVKFSVRGNSYAGGASTRVGWVDGPTSAQVEEVTHAFASSRFDGMDDLKYCANSWHCDTHGTRVERTFGTGDDRSGKVSERCCDAAQSVSFGADHVFAERELSKGFAAELAVKVRRDCGMPAEGDMNDPLPEGSRWHYYPFDAVRDGVHKLARDTAR